MDAALPADAAWSRSAITTMLRLAPQPDLGFVLDVSAATARARKAHEPWQPDVTEDARRYRDTARRHGLRVLSTDGPFAQSNDIVVRDSAMLLMSRFETWGNALFLSNPSQKNTPDPVWQQPFRLPAGTPSEQPAREHPVRVGTAAVLIAATLGLVSLALISGRAAR